MVRVVGGEGDGGCRKDKGGGCVSNGGGTISENVNISSNGFAASGYCGWYIRGIKERNDHDREIQARLVMVVLLVVAVVMVQISVKEEKQSSVVL